MNKLGSMLDYPFADKPAPGRTLEVAPGVHWLRMPLPFALDHINLWVLEDGDRLVLVDTGVGTEATRELWEAWFAEARAARGGEFRVERVIVTHHHPDHLGNAGWLTKRFGAQLWMALGEYYVAHAARDNQAGLTADSQIELYRRNGLDAESLARMAERGNGYRRVVGEMPTSYRRLSESQRVPIGGRDWRVISGYGHSPEHAALYCESLGVLIAGDMVLPRISTVVMVNATEPEGNPLALFLGSLLRYLDLPADTLVLPSHGLPFRGMHERIAQLNEHHRERLSEVIEECASSRTAAEIVPALFRRELDVHQRFLAMGEAMAHLHYLHQQGRLVRQIGADGLVRYAAA